MWPDQELNTHTHTEALLCTYSAEALYGHTSARIYIVFTDRLKLFIKTIYCFVPPVLQSGQIDHGVQHQSVQLKAILLKQHIVLYLNANRVINNPTGEILS